MSAQRGGTFDRVRPRTERTRTEGLHDLNRVDAEGKRALFSTEPSVPAFGALSVECSRCRRTAVLSLLQALRAALPSLSLPILRGEHPTFLRCPSCHTWSWVRIRLRH
jgi:hypothetical protein